jgi:hypothetical protein
MAGCPSPAGRRGGGPRVANRSSPPPGKQGVRGRRRARRATGPEPAGPRTIFGGLSDVGAQPKMVRSARLVAERGRLRGGAAPADLCGREGEKSGEGLQRRRSRHEHGPQGRVLARSAARSWRMGSRGGSAPGCSRPRRRRRPVKNLPTAGAIRVTRGGVRLARASAPGRASGGTATRPVLPPKVAPPRRALLPGGPLWSSAPPRVWDAP